MDPTLQIEFDGTQLLGRPGREILPGLYVKRGGFVGWDDGGADIRREAAARPTSHGEFDAPAYLGARVVTIAGYALARNVHELASLRDSVMAAGATGALTRMEVRHQERVLWANGRRIAATFNDLGLRGSRWLRGEFEIQIVFPDPRKYGETKRFASPSGNPVQSIKVSHRGNFPAFPTIEVANAPANYEIRSPGGSFRISGIADAGVHRIEMATGRVYRNGVRQMGVVSRAQTWAVPPGVEWEHSATSGLIWVFMTDTFI